MLRITALLLTALTGFSALVYEVSWQKYLATLLGSHSEATAAVLGLFLGGLALGYALFGRVTRRRVARARAACCASTDSSRPALGPTRCSFPASSRPPTPSPSSSPTAAAAWASPSTSRSRPS
jgi:hypothetical protein